MKKIIAGAILLTGFLAVPFIAMAAGVCDPLDTANFNPGACYASGGTPGNGGTSGGLTGGTPGGNTSPLSVNATIMNPIKYATFSAFAAGVTKTAVQVLMPFLVLAIIYSGFLFAKAQGNEKGLEEAKTALWYTLIGAFVLFGAWGFAQIIGTTVSTITQ